VIHTAVRRRAADSSDHGSELFANIGERVFSRTDRICEMDTLTVHLVNLRCDPDSSFAEGPATVPNTVPNCSPTSANGYSVRTDRIARWTVGFSICSPRRPVTSARNLAAFGAMMKRRASAAMADASLALSCRASACGGLQPARWSSSSILLRTWVTGYLRVTHTILKRLYLHDAQPRRSREVDHFCSDRVDHAKNRSGHVAQIPSTRFIIHAGGVQVVEQVGEQHYHPRGQAARH
jgi:hypothetical protein